MNIQEKISWLERELEEIKKEVEEKKIQEAEKLKPWEPVYHDFYYSINDTGGVRHDEWGNFECDEKCFEIGNCFKTREEAEFMIERLRVIHELKQFARPFIKDQYNHYICYQHDFNEIRIEGAVCYQDNNLYFSSVEKTWKAIKTVGIDRVKKYYLQVKED